MYGRQAVLEAVTDRHIEVERVLLDRSVRGEFLDSLVAACAERGVRLERVAAERVGRASGHPRQDQGVVADVVAATEIDLDDWLANRPVPVATAAHTTPSVQQEARVGALFVLDGVSNPTNVGMVLRVAVAAGMAATVVPTAGVPELGSLVIKASAGVALRAPILRSATALSAVRSLRTAGVGVFALEADGQPLWSWSPPDASVTGLIAFVLGNESTGVDPDVRAAVSATVAVPLEGGVESLNVAAAAAVVAFDWQRRRHGAGGG